MAHWEMDDRKTIVHILQKQKGSGSHVTSETLLRDRKTIVPILQKQSKWDKTSDKR